MLKIGIQLVTDQIVTLVQSGIRTSTMVNKCAVLSRDIFSIMFIDVTPSLADSSYLKYFFHSQLEYLQYSDVTHSLEESTDVTHSLADSSYLK